METKFIEGTNEQYSIREDGVVIRHYKKEKNNIVHYNNKFLKLQNKNMYELYFDGVCKKISRNTLLKKMFNYVFCNKCDNRITSSSRQITCNNCKKEKSIINRKSYPEKSKEWNKKNPEKVRLYKKKARQNNLEHYKQKEKEYRKKEVETVTKSYVASKIRVSVNDLTNDIYQEYRNLIFLKRDIVKNHNVKMSSLNNRV